MLEEFIQEHFYNGTHDKNASEKIKNQTYYLIDNYSIWLGYIERYIPNLNIMYYNYSRCYSWRTPLSCYFIIII